ncbi:zinc metalloprotease HtpX [Haloechinothrix salitolerans]
MAQGALLLAAMVGVLGLAGWLLFGKQALLWVLAGGAIIALLRPRVPARWVLSMYGARPLPRHAAPHLHRIVAVLAQRAGLRYSPGLYYVASPTANAFAVGEDDDAALAVTDGLLRRLTTRQLAGVLAHEVSHIRNGDTAIMSLSDSIGRFVQVMSYVGLASIILTLPLTLSAGDPTPLLLSGVFVVLPNLVTLLQLALARSREYEADLEGVSLTGDPEGLAQGLIVLERLEGRIWERTMVPHGRSSDTLLLRTHPPTAERVRRLAELTPVRQRHLGVDRPVTLAGYPQVATAPRLRIPGIRW